MRLSSAMFGARGKAGLSVGAGAGGALALGCVSSPWSLDKAGRRRRPRGGHRERARKGGGRPSSVDDLARTRSSRRPRGGSQIGAMVRADEPGAINPNSDLGDWALGAGAGEGGARGRVAGRKRGLRERRARTRQNENGVTRWTSSTTAPASVARVERSERRGLGGAARASWGEANTRRAAISLPGAPAGRPSAAARGVIEAAARPATRHSSKRHIDIADGSSRPMSP
jgi:hypothetical protein